MTTLGTPVWVDFGSTDFAASKAFYEQLFGWRLIDAGENMGHYHMIYSGDGLVGGGMDVAGMTCPEGEPIPSNWTVYLGADDLDATVARAVEAGGTVVMAPMDAGGAGRHALIADPAGAMEGLWQPGEIEGFAFTGEPGTPAWFELMTHDYAASLEFHSHVFDLTMVPMRGPDDDATFRYSTAGPEETASFGVGDAVGEIPAEEGSSWRAYFIVEGCDAALDKVRELGGQVLDGPVDSPYGRIATVRDPAGASFQIMSPTEVASASPTF